MRLFVSIFIFFQSAGAFASTTPQEINIAVKFDHSFYELKFDGGVLTYKEGPQHYSMKLRDCNRSKVGRITKRYQVLAKKYMSQKPQPKTKFDVEVTSSDGKKLEVARGSSFGTWLRDMPKKIMYYNAESQASCKR